MSTITLLNQTDETVCLALFQKPMINPTLATIAWRIAQPPPQGSQTIQIPSDFSLQASYSSDSTKPKLLDIRTETVPFAETTAAFSIGSVASQDRRANGATITQTFDGLVMNEVRVFNNFGVGVQAEICRDGDPIYAPQVIWPGGLFMEDVRATLYVAVVSQFTYKGQRLVQEEISQSAIPVLEGGVLVVTGSMWTGYQLTPN